MILLIIFFLRGGILASLPGEMKERKEHAQRPRG